SSEQVERMRALEAEGVCIFCREPPFEHAGEHWYVTGNDFPYEGTAAHYLIVARRHVQAFEELPDEAGAELWSIRRELAAHHGADRPRSAACDRVGQRRNGTRAARPGRPAHGRAARRPRSRRAPARQPPPPRARRLRHR